MTFSRPNRAAVLTAPDIIELRDWPEPVPGPSDVVVDIAAVGVCGSDVHYFRHGRIGALVADKPIVLGHEAAGTVSAVGSAVSTLEVGDRVTLEPQRPCGHVWTTPFGQGQSLHVRHFKSGAVMYSAC